MAFVTRGFWFYLLLLGSLAFGSDLENQWQSALKSPSSEQTEKWKSWITLAQSQNIRSAEAFYNLAGSFWEKQEAARSVEALIFAIQNRNSVFISWKDLTLLTSLQQNLLNQPEPSSNWELRFNILKESHLKSIWLLGLSWLALLTLFLRFCLKKNQMLYKIMGALWLLVLLLGLSLDWLTKRPFPYAILENGKEMIPLFSAPQAQPDKMHELPSGFIVRPSKKQEGWIFINEPVQGWFEDRFSLRSELFKY